jgi:hypothetical protein
MVTRYPRLFSFHFLVGTRLRNLHNAIEIPYLTSSSANARLSSNVPIETALTSGVVHPRVSASGRQPDKDLTFIVPDRSVRHTVLDIYQKLLLTFT